MSNKYWRYQSKHVIHTRVQDYHEQSWSWLPTIGLIAGFLFLVAVVIFG